MPGCEEQETRVQSARRLQERQLPEEAAALASRVSLLKSCWLPYVRAQRLLGQILGFELDRIDEGIASYQRGLAVDSRQAQLWYELGYLQYRRNDYTSAMTALEKAIIHVRTTPPPQPESFTMECRRLYAESADRLAMLSLGRQPRAVQQAVSSWHDYQDFCEEYGRCAPKDLKLAAQRLEVLAQHLTR
jgi:tetratricopeptide (TPR) repeat protein